MNTLNSDTFYENNLEWEYSNWNYEAELKKFDFPGNKYYLIHNFKRITWNWNKEKWYLFLKWIFDEIKNIWDVKWIYIKAEKEELIKYYKNLWDKLQEENIIKNYIIKDLMFDFIF